MEYQILVAGFGGQGVLSLGKILCSAGMNDDYNVTFYPSYGAEVRGGTCHAGVVIADTPIASPLVNKADALIMLNEPSLKRFLPRVKPNGLVVYNSTLVPHPPEFNGTYDVQRIPATDIANDMNLPRASNMVTIGFFFKFFGLIQTKTFLKDCEKHFFKLSPEMHEQNKVAFFKGYEYEPKHCKR